MDIFCNKILKSLASLVLVRKRHQLLNSFAAANKLFRLQNVFGNSKLTIHCVSSEIIKCPANSIVSYFFSASLSLPMNSVKCTEANCGLSIKFKWKHVERQRNFSTSFLIVRLDDLKWDEFPTPDQYSPVRLVAFYPT